MYFPLLVYWKCTTLVDETGCERRDAIRKYGYGLRGTPSKCQKLLVRGECISVNAAMTSSCVLDLKIVRRGVTGDDFIATIWGFT